MSTQYIDYIWFLENLNAKNAGVPCSGGGMRRNGVVFYVERVMVMWFGARTDGGNTVEAELAPTQAASGSCWDPNSLRKTRTRIASYYLHLFWQRREKIDRVLHSLFQHSVVLVLENLLMILLLFLSRFRFISFLIYLPFRFLSKKNIKGGITTMAL